MTTGIFPPFNTCHACCFDVYASISLLLRNFLYGLRVIYAIIYMFIYTRQLFTYKQLPGSSSI